MRPCAQIGFRNSVCIVLATSIWSLFWLATLKYYKTKEGIIMSEDSKKTVNKQINNQQKNAADDGKSYLKGMPAGAKIALAIGIPVVVIIIIAIVIGTSFTSNFVNSSMDNLHDETRCNTWKYDGYSSHAECLRDK